jgi:hypothetical protein
MGIVSVILWSLMVIVFMGWGSRIFEFAPDSPLEGNGFEPLVPSADWLRASVA